MKKKTLITAIFLGYSFLLALSKQIMKKFIRAMLAKIGYEIKRVYYSQAGIPVDMDEWFGPIYQECKSYTMTSMDMRYSMAKATEYVVKTGIPGDIVEVGVWRGGSMMICARTLLLLCQTSRRIWLYDTFEGMSVPTSKDISLQGGMVAKNEWEKNQRADHNEWCYASLKGVKENMRSTGYPENRITYVKGMIENTIPAQAPNHISILRLDSDWYESTRHALIHLFPLLSKGGVLIIDDYGSWKGARDAVDQFIRENNISILLHRIGDSGRVGIKV